MLEEILVPAGAGVAAGLGVAMPLGAIAALLLREGIVNGFRVAAAGATGVAVVDTTYCTLAALTGAMFAPFVQDHEGTFLGVSGGLLMALGLRQLLASSTNATTKTPDVERTGPWAAFATFVGLTAINPLTLVYFVALAGAVTTRSASWVGPFVFVAAVGLSSWAWQILLAATGAFFGRSLSPRAADAIGVVAALLIVVLGATVVASGVLA